MTYAMVHQPGSNNAQSPFRVIVQKTGRQVDWIARYLDQSCVRGLARHTLRRERPLIVSWEQQASRRTWAAKP